MGATRLRKEEGIGLVVAVALHAAVLAALLFSPRKHDVVKPPQRIEVTISDDVGLTSTAPDPGQAAPDQGPEQGEPAPAAPPVPDVKPAPVPPVEPRPAPPLPRAVEQPKPQPKLRPAPKALPKPAEKTSQRRPSAIDSIVSRPTTRSTPASKATTPARKPGSSAFADAFKEGTPGANAPANTGTPASAIGPQVRSALGAAINRQLKPHWQAPQGAEAELLVTRVRFRLNRDGSLAGDPQVVSTTGQTDANRTQVQRHQEQAVRAVKLAAPFQLPDDLYDGWKVVTTNFDRRLSQ